MKQNTPTVIPTTNADIVMNSLRKDTDEINGMKAKDHKTTNTISRLSGKPKLFIVL